MDSAEDPMMKNEKQWLVEWFRARGPLPESTEEAARTYYFEKGLIDSMDIVDLVTEVEKEFEVRFSEQHFQDRRFATIGGLAEIIAELRGSV